VLVLRDLILGVKVRASANVVGANADEPPLRARAAADRHGPVEWEDT
jgi:hypothetical protein